MSERERGIVKWFNDEKGCGFVARPDDRGDALLTRASLRAGESVALCDGQWVEFSVAVGTTVCEARDVTIINE